MKIDGFDQIAFTVKDLKKARNFYEKTLGLKFLFESGEMAFFDVGGTRLMLGKGEEVVPDPGTIHYLRVKDLKKSFAALKKKKVNIIREPERIEMDDNHELWLAFFTDPDGHTLALLEEKKS